MLEVTNSWTVWFLYVDKIISHCLLFELNNWQFLGCQDVSTLPLAFGALCRNYLLSYVALCWSFKICNAYCFSVLRNELKRIILLLSLCWLIILGICRFFLIHSTCPVPGSHHLILIQKFARLQESICRC